MNLHNPRIAGNVVDLPLFLWAATQQRREYPTAAKRLARRYGLQIPTAAVIASLAGFNACEVRA
jgi:hypothetical protein